MQIEKISVLMIACKYEDGGAPRSMREMILNLSNSYGINIAVVLSAEGYFSEWCRKNHIQYYICGHDTFSETKRKGVRGFLSRRKRGIVSFEKNRKALLKLCQCCNVDDFDIIHTNSNRDCLGALIARKYKKIHVWHLREFGKEDYDVRFLFPFSIWFMNRFTDRFIAISKGVKNSWLTKGLDPQKVEQIYDGVRVTEITRKKYFAEESRPFRVVVTGTLIPSKGQFDVIRAIIQLNNFTRNDVVVDLFYEGYDQEYLSEIKKSISENLIGHIINFCGSSNQIFGILRNYDVGITCSKSEAFGRVTVEYMSAGLITIASNTGANPEIIEDGINVFLYEYGNPESLSRILEKVYHMNINEKQRIGQAAIERVEKNFTDEINAKNVYNLYLDVLNVRKNGNNYK